MQVNENWHQQLKSQHRDQLLESGQMLFLRHGLHQVKIKDVCEEANLSRVTFYKHFHSLDELLLTIQMQLVETLTLSVSQAANPVVSGYEQLESMLHAWVHFSKLHPDHIRFIQLFDINFEAYHFQPDLRDTYEHFIRVGKEKHFLLNALTTGIADGSIQNATPPLKLAQFIFTVMMGMLQKMVTHSSHDLHPLDHQMSEQLVDMLLQYASSENTGHQKSSS